MDDIDNNKYIYDMEHAIDLLQGDIRKMNRRRRLFRIICSGIIVALVVYIIVSNFKEVLG